MPVIEALVPVLHRVFIQNTGTGRHGSAAEGIFSDPIQRYAYQVYSAHWNRGVTLDPVNVEESARYITDLLIDVPDPTVYKKHDEVEVNGTSYVVQGNPGADYQWADGTMPFPEYDDMFGGTVHIRRVT